jgi:hypothetical protein
MGHLERPADLLPLHNRSAGHWRPKAPLKGGVRSRLESLEVLSSVGPGLFGRVAHLDQLLLVSLLLRTDC